eukprot:CAMPEP_0170595776 /NCGR_PEP_ID=MMETSP0224-20130122/14746_1 /TAXON_ID=285029 /ORGANISM="Togula jolla, Strain CCCM 725" /LENGTH=574 /DNA_ID=CAMNT_0010919987 /DNA_START=39 /DNA_END=1763 /DNA_ORIENTATION=-
MASDGPDGGHEMPQQANLFAFGDASKAWASGYAQQMENYGGQEIRDPWFDIERRMEDIVDQRVTVALQDLTAFAATCTEKLVDQLSGERLTREGAIGDMRRQLESQRVASVEVAQRTATASLMTFEKVSQSTTVMEARLEAKLQELLSRCEAAETETSTLREAMKEWKSTGGQEKTGEGGNPAMMAALSVEIEEIRKVQKEKEAQVTKLSGQVEELGKMQMDVKACWSGLDSVRSDFAEVRSSAEALKARVASDFGVISSRLDTVLAAARHAAIEEVRRAMPDPATGDLAENQQHARVLAEDREERRALARDLVEEREEFLRLRAQLEDARAGTAAVAGELAPALESLRGDLAQLHSRTAGVTPTGTTPTSGVTPPATAKALNSDGARLTDRAKEEARGPNTRRHSSSYPFQSPQTMTRDLHPSASGGSKLQMGPSAPLAPMRSPMLPSSRITREGASFTMGAGSSDQQRPTWADPPQQEKSLSQSQKQSSQGHRPEGHRSEGHRSEGHRPVIASAHCVPSPVMQRRSALSRSTGEVEAPPLRLPWTPNTQGSSREGANREQQQQQQPPQRPER